MSLPVPSNFANTYDAGGASVSRNGSGTGAATTFAISADVTNDRVIFSGDTPNAASGIHNFSFTYIII